MYLEHKRVAMQQQKLSAGEVDDAADDRTRQVARIDLQYRWHDERKPTAPPDSLKMFYLLRPTIRKQSHVHVSVQRLCHRCLRADEKLGNPSSEVARSL